ncbi:hypothetical protein FBU59_006647, partial [Linderina macrospora]
TQIDSLISELQADAHCPVRRITGIPSFLSIADSSLKLSTLRAYNRGDILGMDISSGIAALALSPTPGDNILDLCCAPGAKLLFLAELLQSQGSVTGVDIAEHRAATCRSLVKKHAGDDKIRIRVFVEDGTTFGERAPRHGWSEPELVRQAAKMDPVDPKSVRRPWFASKMLASPFALSGSDLYDRVLVDAECTHDGSLVHIKKYEQWGYDKLAAQVISDDRSSTVPVLQSKLLENGWRLLKPGGTLVYSTCSLSRFQNEAVVGGFLKRHPDAALQPISVFGPESAITPTKIWTPDTFKNDETRHIFDRMQHAARLDPLVSNTSGMFIARIYKPLTSTHACQEQEIVPLDI